MDASQVSNPGLPADAVDHDQDELARKTDFGHFLDLPDGVGELAPGGVESLGRDDNLGLVVVGNHEIARGGSIMATSESSAFLVRQPKILDDGLDLILDSSAGFAGFGCCDPTASAGHQNVGKLVLAP